MHLQINVSLILALFIAPVSTHVLRVAAEQYGPTAIKALEKLVTKGENMVTTAVKNQRRVFNTSNNIRKKGQNAEDQRRTNSDTDTETFRSPFLGTNEGKELKRLLTAGGNHPASSFLTGNASSQMYPPKAASMDQSLMLQTFRNAIPGAAPTNYAIAKDSGINMWPSKRTLGEMTRFSHAQKLNMHERLMTKRLRLSNGAPNAAPDVASAA